MAKKMPTRQTAATTRRSEEGGAEVDEEGVMVQDRDLISGEVHSSYGFENLGDLEGI